MSILRRPVVLAYHGVGGYGEGSDPDRLIISLEHLEEQIRMLQRRGYTFLTAAELLARYSGAKPTEAVAVLTFDDGWVNNLTIATPVLKRMGVRATFYVCPGLWGGQHANVSGPEGRLLTREAARALHAEGMELGGHSMTHPDLRNLETGQLRAELSECKDAIEAIAGEPCRTFAYPFGLFEQREERAVAAAGYEMALAWLPGPWKPFATPRLPAPPRHGARRLALKMLGVRRPGP